MRKPNPPGSAGQALGKKQVLLGTGDPPLRLGGQLLRFGDEVGEGFFGVTEEE